MSQPATPENTITYDPYGYYKKSNAPESQLTQSAAVPEPQTPEVVYETLFAQEAVKRLGSDNFMLSDPLKIVLDSKSCTLVLFYGRNTESNQLVKIFAVAAQQVVGPLFAAVNLFVERRLAEAFTAIRSDGTHPLHWAGLRGYPFVLVYQAGWPVAFYNGDRSVQALSDFSLTLACQAGYREPAQLSGGVQVEANYEMGPDQAYQNLEGEPARVRTVSSQYTTGSPIRGYDPRLVPVVAGSKLAGQEATKSLSEQEKAQIETRKTGQAVSPTAINEEPQLATVAAPVTAATRTPTRPPTART